MEKRISGMPERIKQMREQKRMTQAELAGKLHLSRASVNGWELGISMPSLQTIAELCETFGVSADFIIGLERGSVVSVDGLGEREVRAVMEVIDCFKKRENTDLI